MKPLKMNMDVETTAIEEAYVQQMQQAFGVLVENVITSTKPQERFEKALRYARQAREIALRVLMDSPVMEE